MQILYKFLHTLALEANMNKYLKILALSGGILGSITPLAIKTDDTNNDLYKIYESVERLQNVVPKLGKINYKLDINNTQDPNVSFISTDDNGQEVTLDNTETITYLNQTLEQTNAEYERLKTTLTNAIKETMDYLDSYKQSETELTNEQKIYIKEHINSIKFLAETLENLSEDVLCSIDGCENTDNDDEFETTAGKYISIINDLESRIQALHHSLNSLQFINNIGNPFFFSGYSYYHNSNNINSNQTEEDSNLNIDDEQSNDNNNDNTIENNINEEDNENTNINDEDSSYLDNENETNMNNQEHNLDNQVQEVEQSNTNDTQNNNTAPTTFGLKSNIDTYAPTKRNIDTFFNTALQNEYMHGGGYMPYGYGYGHPYGMPYNSYYGNPYGMNGINSNVVNKSVLNNENSLTSSPIANIENEVQEETKQPKKIRPRPAKNIDTYTGTTIQSNVNTMGESKISNYLKEKLNNLRNKMRKNKDKIEENNLENDFKDSYTNKTLEEVEQQTEVINNENNTNNSVNLDNSNSLENINQNYPINETNANIYETSNLNESFNTNIYENSHMDNVVENINSHNENTLNNSENIASLQENQIKAK